MDYELIFADRRSVRLQLRDDGSLLVRAPRWMSRREVDAFVASKERWICEKRAILARGKRDWGGAGAAQESGAGGSRRSAGKMGGAAWRPSDEAHHPHTACALGKLFQPRRDQSQCAALAGAGDGARLCRRARALSYEGNEPFAAFLGGGWAHLAELRRKPRLAQKQWPRTFAKESKIMKIIISPAKKMNIDSDTLPARSQPVFSDEASQLAALLRALAPAERQKIWQCSDKLAAENSARLAAFEQSRAQTPAILAYEGLQYQHMAPQVMSRDALVWLDDHLRILSGFYGVLRPFDAVLPYRLEMQAKLAVDGARDLYAFWGGRLYEALEEDALIVNLASEEYAKAVRPYVQPAVRFVSVRFGEFANGRVKQKGTFAKMARGEMVRYMAENQISDLDSLRDFDALGLRYADALSDDSTLTFLIS